MKIVYSDRHRLHRGDKEMYRGELVPCFEKPQRADYVHAAVKARNIGPVLQPKEFPAMVVSLGVDTFADDPISKFQLREPEYLRLGVQIAALNLPTLFVLEGGYAVSEIGHNVAHVLRGFDDAIS